jgi:hypothetical protein
MMKVPSKVIWYGTIDHFEVFSNNIECYYEQIGAGYLLESRFQEAYLERVMEFCVDFLVKYLLFLKDVYALYGASLSECQIGVGRRIL